MDILSALMLLLGSGVLMLRLGGGSFPRPLKPSEEEACVRRWVEEGDVSARNELIEHNLRLVAHVMKKY